MSVWVGVHSLRLLRGGIDLVRIFSVALVAAALVVARGAPIRAQQGPDLEALLKSYGFQLKQEDGRQVVEVTLHQVLQLALERNLTLQSVRFGETVAQSALRAASDRFTPTLANSADYNRTLVPSLSVTPSTLVELRGTSGVTLSSQITKPTETGLSYSLKYTERQAHAVSNSIPISGGSDTGLLSGSSVSISALTGSLTVPFGQDAGRDFNALPQRRAEAALTGSQLTIQQNQLTLLQATASTYWDLVATLENLSVQQEAVKLSEQLLRDNRQRLQAGVLSPFDVQVSETQLARDRQSLAAAKAEVLRIEDLARALLNLQTIDFQVRPVDRPKVHKIEEPYTDLLRRLYDYSPDIRQLENQLRLNNLDLQNAQNGDRANLDLQLFYTAQGIGGSAFGGVSGFSKTGLDSYGATLTWTVPLFNVQTPEAIRQATLARQQIQLQLDSRRSDLNVQLQGVLRQIQVAQEQVDAAVLARKLADEQLKNEIERFRVGESTSFQVAQSQQGAASAQVQEILARLNFERNFLQLEVLTGDIYRHYDLTPSESPK